MPTYPYKRDQIRKMVRSAMQDFSTVAAEQDVPDDDSGSNNSLGINTWIDESIRQVCAELDIMQGTFRAPISLVSGQSIYTLPLPSAAGAFKIQALYRSTTQGSGNLTDQYLEYQMAEITFEDLRLRFHSEPNRTTGLGTPLWWCAYPKDVASSIEATPRFQVWPVPGADAVTKYTLSPMWHAPIVGLPDDTTVLSIPAPAGFVIANRAASWILDDRGDHGDALRAFQRSEKAMQLLTATYASKSAKGPLAPQDRYLYL